MDTHSIRAYLDEFQNPSVTWGSKERIVNAMTLQAYKAELDKKRLGFVLAVTELQNDTSVNVLLEELLQARETVLKRGFVKEDAEKNRVYTNDVLDAIMAGHKVFECFYSLQVIDGILFDSVNKALSCFEAKVKKLEKRNTVKKESDTDDRVKSETPLQKKLSDYPELLTVKDIKEIFGVSDRTVTNWQRDGLLVNVSEVSEEQTILGRKKRGKEKRYKKEAVMHNLLLNEKYNATSH